MIVSRKESWSSCGVGKTVVAIGSRRLEARVRTSMRRLGITVKSKAKLAGKKSRWLSIASRCYRAVRLGRRLGGHVFRTGLQPAALYGASVAIPSIGIVRGMQRAAARTVGPLSGRSVTARLATARCDPAYEAARRPIAAWVNAIWECSFLHPKMARAWMHAQSVVAGSLRPSISAGGSAGSLLAALRRVGWVAPAFKWIKTLDGSMLDLTAVAPRTVMRYLADDFAITSAANSGLGKRLAKECVTLGGGYALWESPGEKYYNVDGRCIPWFEPAAAVLNSRWAKTQPAQAVASVSALVEGGWWPQDRLFQHNLAADPICRACGVETGTLLHRCCLCATSKEWREAECPKWLRELAAKDQSDPLFCQGVPRRPACPPPPPETEQWMGTVPKDGPLACGHAYTDGAMRGVYSRAKRAGWAFVVSVDGVPRWGKYGGMSEAYPTALRAELRALLEILRHSAGDLIVHVDNQQVVDGVRRGEKWCTAAVRDGADLWRLVWTALRDLSGVQVLKVKAHLKFAHVLDGVIPCAHWCGNAIADRWAKSGCSEASAAAPCHEPNAQWNRAVAWYRWLVRMAVAWTPDTAPSGPRPTDMRPSPAEVPRRSVAVAVPHELWRNVSRWWCRKCGITALSWGPRTPASLRRSCLGSMAERCSIQGRRLAVPPAREAADDGAVSHALLAARGAQRVEVGTAASSTTRSPNLATGGYAGVGSDSAAATTASVIEVEQPEVIPLESASEDEDPFGHARLDFDNQPHAAPAATVEESRASSTGEREADVSVGVEHGSSQAMGAHPSHALRLTRYVVWCAHCGRHAPSRLGVGLVRKCRGVADGGYPSRILRMKAGQHPITGEYL